MISLSIIIPFQNRDELFIQLLNSLLKSTVVPFEVILVGNNAITKSLNIAKNFQNQANSKGWKVNIIECDKLGAAAARNLGLSVANGDWVYFFDDDDNFDSQFVADIVALKNIANYHVIALPTTISTSNGKLHKKHFAKKHSSTYQILSSFLATQNLVFRKDFINSIHGWNESLFYWNDWELGFRVLQARPQILFLHKSYHIIFSHKESITGEGFHNRLPQIFKAFSVLRQDILNSPTHHFQQLLKTMYYKEAIVGGKICLEGYPFLSKMLLVHIRKQNHSKYQWNVCLLLYKLTTLGYRGIWRLAVYL